MHLKRANNTLQLPGLHVSADRWIMGKTDFYWEIMSNEARSNSNMTHCACLQQECYVGICPHCARDVQWGGALFVSVAEVGTLLTKEPQRPVACAAGCRVVHQLTALDTWIKSRLNGSRLNLAGLLKGWSRPFPAEASSPIQGCASCTELTRRALR